MSGPYAQPAPSYTLATLSPKAAYHDTTSPPSNPTDFQYGPTTMEPASAICDGSQRLTNIIDTEAQRTEHRSSRPHPLLFCCGICGTAYLLLVLVYFLIAVGLIVGVTLAVLKSNAKKGN